MAEPPPIANIYEENGVVYVELEDEGGVEEEEFEELTVYSTSEDEEEEEEEEEEEDVPEHIPIRNSPIRSLPTGAQNHPAPVRIEEANSKRRRRAEGIGETGSLIGDEYAESSQGKEWNRNEIDGLFCPICMDAWTSEGDHHICCLPCGHLFGLSCISKWLKQNRNSTKCPQCNRKSTLKDVRKLFAPRIAVVDEESQKTIKSLEVKCAALEKKGDDWCRKESEWQRREAELQNKVKQLTERTAHLEHILRDLKSNSNVVSATRSSQRQMFSGNSNSEFCSQQFSSSFVLKTTLHVDEARIFDIDAFGQIILFARRLPKIGGSSVLTKMNLLPPHESDDISLPSSMKIVKDLHISPFNGSHILCASLGKKLSLLSMESNNIILSYDLPAAAWSCSWDCNSSHYIYAGLQNGLLLAFDIRQTGSPVESIFGITNNPIHTVHSLPENSSSGVRSLLSASSIGICHWNFGCAEERPSLIPQTANQGVCISLACCSSSGDIVATYRPRVETSSEMVVTQPSLTPPSVGGGVQGSHLHLKRVGDRYQELGAACSTVSNIRLPKSVIVDNQEPLFAVGDELTCGLIMQELPSFNIVQRLLPHKQLICDVKYMNTLNHGLLGCLSSDTLQLFSRNLS